MRADEADEGSRIYVGEVGCLEVLVAVTKFGWKEQDAGNFHNTSQTVLTGNQETSRRERQRLERDTAIWKGRCRSR